MAEVIKNGDNGNTWHIDEDNRGHVFAVVETQDKAVNKEGEQWSLPFTVTPVGAGDYFFFFKNTGTQDLAITDLRTMCASAETITYHWVTGTPTYTSDTDIDPVAKNGASSKIPTATIKSDTNTTGLTDEGEMYFDRLDTANKMYKLSTTANIIIPQGSQFALKATTGGAEVKCVISILNL